MSCAAQYKYKFGRKGSSRSWGFHGQVLLLLRVLQTSIQVHCPSTFLAKHKPNHYLLGQYVGVNGATVRSTTELKAILWASQHAIFWIYRLFSVIDSIVTPFKSEVWSREIGSSKRPSETRTAFARGLHTRRRVLPRGAR